jgi:hypothetical protein
MAVERHALRQIGKLIHRHFNDIVNEPLPPRLQELIERLKDHNEVAKSQNIEKLEEPPQAPLTGLPSFRSAPA